MSQKVQFLAKDWWPKLKQDHAKQLTETFKKFMPKFNQQSHKQMVSNHHKNIQKALIKSKILNEQLQSENSRLKQSKAPTKELRREQTLFPSSWQSNETQFQKLIINGSCESEYLEQSQKNSLKQSLRQLSRQKSHLPSQSEIQYEFLSLLIPNFNIEQEQFKNHKKNIKQIEKNRDSLTYIAKHKYAIGNQNAFLMYIQFGQSKWTCNTLEMFYTWILNMIFIIRELSAMKFLHLDIQLRNLILCGQQKAKKFKLIDFQDVYLIEEKNLKSIGHLIKKKKRVDKDNANEVINYLSNNEQKWISLDFWTETARKVHNSFFKVCFDQIKNELPKGLKSNKHQFEDYFSLIKSFDYETLQQKVDKKLKEINK